MTSFYQRVANHVFFYLLFNLRNLLYLIGATGFFRKVAKKSSLRRLLELTIIQLGVEALLCQQLLAGTALDDASISHHQDEVGVLDGRQPMGEEAGDTSSSETYHGLVEDKQRGIFDYGSGGKYLGLGKHFSCSL